jgi:hypothetical protein
LGVASNEVLYEPPSSSQIGRPRLGLISAVAYLVIFVALIVIVGPGFFFALWPAWVLLGAFGLAQVLILLQGNRFGVYAYGIAPTYRPWRLWSPRRLIIPVDRLRHVELRGVGAGDREPLTPGSYFQCIIELSDGGRVTIPSHGGYRSLRRQLRSEHQISEAAKALQEFAVRVQAGKGG